VHNHDGTRNVLPYAKDWNDLRTGADESARVESFVLCCDFIRRDADQQAADRLLARLHKTAAAPAGTQYSIVSIAGIKPGVRIGLILAGSAIPPPLKSVGGWRGFKYETLRTQFQFRRDENPDTGSKPLVDEELHERIRHVLRRITVSFSK
jgi:hypothetical protein